MRRAITGLLALAVLVVVAIAAVFFVSRRDGAMRVAGRARHRDPASQRVARARRVPVPERGALRVVPRRRRRRRVRRARSRPRRAVGAEFDARQREHAGQSERRAALLRRRLRARDPPRVAAERTAAARDAVVGLRRDAGRRRRIDRRVPARERADRAPRGAIPSGSPRPARRRARNVRLRRGSHRRRTAARRRARTARTWRARPAASAATASPARNAPPPLPNQRAGPPVASLPAVGLATLAAVVRSARDARGVAIAQHRPVALDDADLRALDAFLAGRR